MNDSRPRSDEFTARLPLPLAQLYRRAVNAKTALDRHHHAYYLAEATLKLAACLRVGTVLDAGIEPLSPLARSLEQLCLPSIGHWARFVREASEALQKRPDAALLPLAGSHEALFRAEALAAVRAFAERASSAREEAQPPLTTEEARSAARRGILGFFDLIAAYRNQVFGHGGQRTGAFYEELGPLLLEASCEVLDRECLFGGLMLAVARLKPDPTARAVEIEWQGLRGLGSFTLPRESVGAEPASVRVVPGEVYFVARGVRVPLHPLVVYQEDRAERERVGFLNRTLLRQAGGEVRRVDHLDYATGDLLLGIDAREALAAFLGRLRGRKAQLSDVDRLIEVSQAEAHEVPPPSLGPGAAIGEFDLEGELGRGGMGVVYRARQRSLNRPVALKVLSPALAGDPVALARFRREIAALARCEHPSLVKILTSGSDGDRHYFAMELVDGGNLSTVLDMLSKWGRESVTPLIECHLTAAVSSSSEKRRDAATHITLPALEKPDLSPPPAVGEGRALYLRLAELFAGAADAVAHLHARGIVHRDLKPGNLMLTADGARLVVMDLGLAQVRDRSQNLTRTGTRWVGTLRYSAPEQLQQNLLDVDERADVYGLGATLYEMVALAPLFDGDTEPRLIEQVLHAEPKPLAKVQPTVPRDLAAIIAHCLEKDRTRRYANARDLAEDLRQFAQGRAVRVRPVGTAQRLWRWCRRNKALAVASALAIVGLVAVAGLSSLFALRQAENARELEKRVAQNDLGRGRLLCEQGNVALGLQWMARALRDCPMDAKPLEESIRINLDAWSRRWTAPQFVLPHRFSVVTADFSVDGKTVLTGSWDQTAQLWSCETGEPVGPPIAHPDWVRSVALSPDGTRALIGGDRIARMWSIVDRRPIGPQVVSEVRYLNTIGFSPDGRMALASGISGTPNLWLVETGETVGPALRHDRGPVIARFTPDGRVIVTGGGDNTARFWSVQDGKPLGEPLQHEGPVVALGFDAEGRRLFTNSGNSTVRVWEIATREPVGKPITHTSALLDAAFSPDGERILIACGDRTARLWRVATGEPVGALLRHDSEVSKVAFSPDGLHVVTVCGDRSAWLWTLETTEWFAVRLQHVGQVETARFSPDGKRVLTTSLDGTAKLWSSDPVHPTSLTLPVGGQDAALSSVGREVAVIGSATFDVSVFSAETGALLGSKLKHPTFVWAAAFSPDGRTILTGSADGVARVWSLESRTEIGPTFRHEAAVVSVAWSHDGERIFTASWDKTARIWIAKTGESLGHVMRHDAEIREIAVSPDRETLLTVGFDRTARLWSSRTGESLGAPFLHRRALESCAFMPDGRKFLTSEGCLWTIRDRSCVRFDFHHSDAILGVAISPDGRLAATASRDRTAKLWSLETGELLGPPLPHDQAVEDVAFSPDGRRLLTTGRGSSKVWPVPLPSSGTVERIALWIEAITGAELPVDGPLRPFDSAEQAARRRQLEALGGAPVK